MECLKLKNRHDSIKMLFRYYGGIRGKVCFAAVRHFCGSLVGLHYNCKHQLKEYKVVASREREILFFIIRLLEQCGPTNYVNI